MLAATALCACVLLYEVLAVDTDLVEVHEHSDLKANVSKGYGPRTFNGDLATDDQFPFMVLLLLEKDKHPSICSACYVRANWVVAPAHCLFQKELINPHDVIALGGRANVDVFMNHTPSKPIIFPQIRRAKSVHVHPDFDSEAGNYDIGMVELVKDFVAPVTPGPLANETQKILHNCTIVGWGGDDPGVNTRSLRFATDLTFYSPEQGCAKGDSDLAVMCYKTNPKGAMPTSAGGVSICNNLIYGLASAGGGKLSEIYYTDVPRVKGWMNDVMDISPTVKPNALLVVLIALVMTLTTH